VRRRPVSVPPAEPVTTRGTRREIRPRRSSRSRACCAFGRWTGCGGWSDACGGVTRSWGERLCESDRSTSRPAHEWRVLFAATKDLPRAVQRPEVFRRRRRRSGIGSRANTSKEISISRPVAQYCHTLQAGECRARRRCRRATCIVSRLLRESGTVMGRSLGLVPRLWQTAPVEICCTHLRRASVSGDRFAAILKAAANTASAVTSGSGDSG